MQSKLFFNIAQKSLLSVHFQIYSVDFFKRSLNKNTPLEQEGHALKKFPN
jgi:hypothetical protein